MKRTKNPLAPTRISFSLTYPIIVYCIYDLSLNVYRDVRKNKKSQKDVAKIVAASASMWLVQIDCFANVPIKLWHKWQYIFIVYLHVQ